MHKGTLLLASSGKEFSKPTGLLTNPTEVKRARKEAMGRLGLDFLDSVGAADDMDLDKELAVEAEAEALGDPDTDLKQEATPAAESPMDTEFPNKEFSPPARSHSSTPVVPSPITPSTPAEANDLNGLSARERNRLKRKRKAGNSAFVHAPPPPSSGAGTRYTAASAGPSNKCGTEITVFCWIN